MKTSRRKATRISLNKRLYKFTLCIIIFLSMILLHSSILYAFTFPDIKQTFTYTARARNLSLGISFELYQQNSYSLELQLANNFVGISILKQFIPLVEIGSGFTLGYNPHLNIIDYGLVILAWISW